jgi:sigma-E factor negative regulatory protein RseA
VEFAQNGFNERSGNAGMSDSVKEQLSACLDGELADQELDLLLKRVGRDADLGPSIGRYALIGEALRGQVQAPSATFVPNLMAKIESEPALDAAPSRRSTRSSKSFDRFLRPLAGVAIAASVAVAVLSIQRIAAPPTAQQPAPAATVAATSSAPQPSYVVPATTQDVSFVPATRLTNYVVAHSEYTSPLSRRTLLSGVLSEDDDPSADQPTEAQVKVTSEKGKAGSTSDTVTSTVRTR